MSYVNAPGSPEGYLAGSDPAGEGGRCVHMSTLPDAVPGIPKGGSLPSTAACPGAALALRRPCRNCKTASDIRKRCRAHGNDVSAHMHPDVSCALADQQRPSPLRVQSPPPGSRLERHVVRGRMQWMQWPSARGSCGPAPGCRGSGRPPRPRWTGHAPSAPSKGRDARCYQERSAVVVWWPGST